MRKLVAMLAVLLSFLLSACGGSSHHSTSQQKYHTKYGVSAHPQNFGVPPKGVRVPRPALGVPTAEQYDTVTLSTIPHGAPYLAGYTAGYWPTYNSLTQLSWHPHVKSIAIAARYHAMCLDVEPGDASPDQAVGWYHAISTDPGMHGSKPCFYAALFNGMQQIRADLNGAGISRNNYWLWDADWTYAPHLDFGYDCTQWTDHAFNSNLDESTCSLAFLGTQPKPPPPPPPANLYLLYDNSMFSFQNGHLLISERATVEDWDKHKCINPVRRKVCITDRHNITLLQGRVYYVAWHQFTSHGWVKLSKPRWSYPKGEPLGVRFQGLSVRLRSHTPTTMNSF